jgi:flagellar hook-associated protein 1
VALNGILNNALTGLNATSRALDVVADNITNVNTDGYVKRTANMGTLSFSGDVQGVEVTDVARTVSNYLDQETLTSTGTSSQYETQSGLYDQINALLGQVGDGGSLASQLTNITSALATATQSPSNGTSKASVVSALKTFAAKVATLDSSLTGLRNSADQQISTAVATTNTLFSQIADLNAQIRTETAMGDDASGLCDQRATALKSLAAQMDINTVTQPDGTVKVTTTDGTTLIGSYYAQLSYTGGNTSTGYNSVEISYINPSTGKAAGSPTELDPHLASGSLKGLIEMRDGAIGELQTELGNLAKTAATAYNSVSNQYSASTPPDSLTGRQTGLLDGDTLNIQGSANIVVTDASGNLVHTGAISYASGDSVGDIVSAIDGALVDGSGNPVGTATFSDGVLSVQMNTGYGVAVQNTGAASSDTNLSGFFGLNDLFQTSIPSASATGLTATDTCGGSGTITLALKNEKGATVKTATVNVAGSDQIGATLTDLGTALGGAVTFTLNADGSVTTDLGSGYQDCTLTVVSDSTTRTDGSNDTGVNLTSLLGIGDNTVAAYAADFAVKSGLSADTLPSGSVANTTKIGAAAVGSGDASGLAALENVETANQSIDAAGSLTARTASLGNYANAIYQDIATRSTTASDNYDTQNDRLTEAKSLQSNVEGVNLDQELSNMVVYQQAYNASARLLTTYNDLYSTLLNIGQS